MKALLFIILAAFTIHAQSSQSLTTEATELRDQFIAASKEYASTLDKLLESYERDVKTAEVRLAIARDLFSQQLLSESDVKDTEQRLATAKANVAKAKERQTALDEELKNVPSVADLVKDMKRTRRNRAGCKDWTLTAYRRETKDGVTVSFKIRCRRLTHQRALL